MKPLALICACLLLAACGQRGALYLPEKPSAEVPPTTVAPTTPQTTPPADPTDPDKKKDEL